MTYEYLPFIATAFISALLVWLITFLMMKQKYEAELEKQHIESEAEITLLEERLDGLTRSDETHKERLEQSKKSYLEEKERSIVQEQQNAIYKERIEGLNRAIQSTSSQNEERFAAIQKKLEESQEKFSHLQDEYTKALSQIAELETLLESERKIGIEKLELLQKNREHLKLEFKELADTILKNNSEKFSSQNNQKLSEMITPIREQFDAFKKQINDVYIKETKERSALQGEIRLIKELNEQMRKDAKNLTNALKGESKTQGIWGEMILERVLENSGLREGESYKREVSLEHESDHTRYRPDVIVYLPDRREIIIDAKTSLRAYEQYISSKDDSEKKHFADQHIASVKKHIRELSDKDYTGLKGIVTLDFIFMFIPVESALLMAMEYDPGLFDFAFKKNVILVGPTTLMVALRAVENTWKQEHQQRNAQEIAKRAGLLFDKFVGFVESVDKLGKQINTVQKTYEETYARLHTGAGSLTGQFQKLEKLGAAASKRLPEHVLREIDE